MEKNRLLYDKAATILSVPSWRIVAGAVLIAVGIWSLYQTIWTELCRINEGSCWIFLPAPEAALPNAAFGTAILAGGIILLLSGWRRTRSSSAMESRHQSG